MKPVKIPQLKRSAALYITLLGVVVVILSMVHKARLSPVRQIGNNTNHVLSLPDTSLLHSGDVIFRHGTGIISNLLLKFSQQDSRYSHVGILSKEKNRMFVYHMIGGELNPGAVIKREPIEQFCSQDIANNFGIYRTDIDSRGLQVVDSLLKYYFLSKLAFDTGYDLNTDDAMYCTEFVYKVITKASGNENYLTLSQLTGFTYIACDNLYLSPHFKTIYFHSYSQ